MISRGTSTHSIVKDFVTDGLTDSSKMVFIDPLKYQTLGIIRTLSDVGNSRIDHGMIGTPIVNKHILSEDDNFRVKIDVEEAEKLVTIVQRSPANEGNTASP